MSNIDKSLAKTAYSGINYDNILQDVMTIIQNDPNFSNSWEDFTSSDAGRMIMELYAFVGDALATRLDWYINEGYLPTASQRQSVIKLLKLIGYKMSLPTSSHVDVYVTPKSNIGVSTLTQYKKKYNNPSFYPFSLSASGLNNATLNFELLKFNPDTQTFSYHEDVEYKNSTEYFTFWEGTTIIEDFIVETTNNQIFKLTYSDVTKNSIQVYKVTQDGDTVNEHPLTYVTSFLSKEAQRKTDDSFSDKSKEDYEIDIPYTYNVEEGKITIEFAPISLIPSSDKRPSLGDKIRVFYRVGGGANTNIIKKAINTTVTIESDLTQDVTQLKFINPSAATGGEDEESTEHAKEYAPLTVRAQERTVNEEDYSTIGDRYDIIYKMRTYGAKNLDADDVYDRYGEFIKPLEAWNYILCKNNGYQDLKNDEYNKFRWITQRFENRFNEPYAFRKGRFNYGLYTPEIKNNDTYKNYISFIVPDTFTDFLNLTISKNETPKSEKHFDNVLSLFDENIIKIDGEERVLRIENEFAPQRTSVSLINNPFPDKKIHIAIDNNEVDVEFLSGYITGDPSFPANYAKLINEAYGQETHLVYPAKIMFKTKEDPNFFQTNSENSDGNSLTFRIKLKKEGQYIEEDVVIVLGTYSEFADAISSKIAEVFDLSPNRVEASTYQPEYDGDLFRTEITLSNTGYSDYINFIEITSYPDTINEGEPIEDKIYGGGDYTEVATVGTNLWDNNNIVIKSPNTGKNANIVFFKNTEAAAVTDTFFDIKKLTKDETIYGSNTITYDENTNTFFFENGFFDFKEEKNPDGSFINGPYIYINYIVTNNTEIDFGNYAYKNFSLGDPEYREPATRIYNTIYTDTDINYTYSEPIIKFASEKQDVISLFSGIEEFTYGDDQKLIPMKSPTCSFEYAPILETEKRLIIGIDVTGISYNTSVMSDISTFKRSSETISISLNSIRNADTLVNDINIKLSNKIGADKPPIFKTFAFARIEGDYIILTTPTISKDSNVCYYITGSDTNDNGIIIKKAEGDYTLTETYKTIKSFNVSGNSVLYNDYNTTGEINIGDRVVFDGGNYLTVASISEIDPEEYDGKNRRMIIQAAHNENYNLQYAIANSGGIRTLYFTDDILHLQKLSENFPDLDIYANYISDKRYIENVYERFYDNTEEDDLKNYFDKYKIISIENVFKQPIVNTFDIAGTVYYNPRLYTEDFVKNMVESALKEKFSLNNMDFGESIKKSKIFSTIQNLSCVRWADVGSIKRSYSDPDPDEDKKRNEIKCYFDEILILSDNYKDESGTNHGIIFNYTTES